MSDVHPADLHARKIQIEPKKSPIDGKAFHCNLTAQMPRSETLNIFNGVVKSDFLWCSVTVGDFHNISVVTIITVAAAATRSTISIYYLSFFFLYFPFLSPPHFMAGNVRVVGQIVGDCIL